ncbi:hypothetical protein LEP1GSC055_0258 [Leptospira borgpetersenii str. Brem 307]|uniref:Uncharacterized protein n=1 Tax=Leptospira borgpetersenii str. Brem 328 TaxID=1049780 RepID=A0ABC9SKU1_LEPBO|nr:hypothetical protein LEP1GSC055_0258 [Leptospira borgpetersenii str. Brem 307]EMN18341.1 hypothetical protein LEP1GSC056_0644 [Leptospira borgpetersenii str. Brem 328]
MGTPTFSLYYELLKPISFFRFWDKFLYIFEITYRNFPGYKCRFM